ncbi:unnamed protein product, partial [Pylaiella littoralis]
LGGTAAASSWAHWPLPKIFAPISFLPSSITSCGRCAKAFPRSTEASLPFDGAHAGGGQGEGIRGTDRVILALPKKTRFVFNTSKYPVCVLSIWCPVRIAAGYSMIRST